MPPLPRSSPASHCALVMSGAALPDSKILAAASRYSRASRSRTTYGLWKAAVYNVRIGELMPLRALVGFPRYLHLTELARKFSS
jgi:hypothetical protein